MTLRKLLIFPLLISIVFFAVFSVPIINDAKALLSSDMLGSVIGVYVMGAILLQFAAHYIRAYKMSYLMEPTSSTASSLQFKALSIGYLFNTILPFRLGELIRAQVIAYTKSTSFGFSLTLVIIERIVDLFFLTIFGLIFAVVGVLSWAITPYLIATGVLGVVALILLVMVWKEYAPLMSLVRRVSGLLNDNLRVQVRFKYWTIMYGLQKTITRRRILKYIMLTSVMWSGYTLSVFIMILAMKGISFDFSQVLAPFYAMSIPSGPANLGSYSHVYNEFAQYGLAVDKVRILATWAFLVLPMGAVGIYNLASLKVPVWRKLQKGAESDDLINKLSRKRDISSDLSLFLDNYLSGNSLSKIVNRRERHDGFKLVRYFKGGSDAITILVNKNKRNVVEKIIALDFKDRLKAQYDWLVQYRDPHIVTALKEETGPDYYAIELEYNKHNEMFFDYIHRTSFDESKRIFDSIWDTLDRTVHKKTKKVVGDTKSVKTYVDKHFYGCLEKALEVSDDLRAVIGQDEIVINGKQYLNAYSVMEKIMNDKTIMRDLGTYASSGAVHGDVIVDNILVSKESGDVTVIDPAPDGNIINGRVFDFGKNMQSLYCGYEFLFRGDKPALLGNDGSIAYHDQRSLRYMQLCDYVCKTLAPRYLTKAEERAMIFHAGVLLMRRLKHQVYQEPRLTLAMYAAGVKALNDFYHLYHK